ncbi:MAG: glycosyltransferase family 39 protein [Deltaproteobacteria bacterium]|nr:glycosyltransferase family 39 protein [Deltaproteobacteria bacterium]
MADPQNQTSGHDAAELRGRTEPWTATDLFALTVALGVGLWYRLRELSAEGFGDDEVHKWLASGRYLHGDFSGDDVEHPMLMKVLITAVRWFGEPRGWAPELITRLPNAAFGGVSILVVALLGRRLFGRAVGVYAALFAAVSTTFIGYQRVAKEDTLLGLFLMLLCWCLAEAKAAADDARTSEQRRWELWGAASLAGMLASKYFPWLALAAPIFVFSVRKQSMFRVPGKRWAQLIGLAFVLWIAVNWSPFLPSTWVYAKSYTTGQQTVHGSLYFMGRIYHNLVEYGWNGTPPWFYAVFTAVKLTPPVFLLAMAGLVIALAQRKPAHKLLFAWMGVWFFVHSLSGSKWGRFYTSVLPAFLILGAYTIAWVQQVLMTRAPKVALFVPFVTLLVLWHDTEVTKAHFPHARLYISALGGGDKNVDWFFPHCDDFDAGFREAMEYIAQHAEPGAEVSTEIDWPAELYAKEFHRADLKQTLMRRGRTCRAGTVCYVVTQRGRRYFLNEDALANLAKKEPWHVEQLLGQDVVKVYRLPPGESPFADENVPH